MIRNVLSNWIWYGFVVISGFLLPRLIDNYQGQELLGVWDFGWSIVVYIKFLSLGINGAVNPYVARFRAVNDTESLNTAVNSSFLILAVGGILGALMSVALALLTPHLLKEGSTEAVDVARMVLLLLGFSSAIELPGGVFNGVITGHERYDLLNRIRIAQDCGVLLVALLMLAMGRGIVTLAAVVCIGEVLAQAARFVVARLLFADMRLSFRFCKGYMIRDMLLFGGKAIMRSFARAGTYQGSSVLVTVFLGPAYLAVYSRQRALAMHLSRFVSQYAQVFIPRSSKLGAQGDHEALRNILIDTSKYGLYVTLPAVLLMATMGAPLLNLWMGPEYEAPLVLGVMAVGHLVFIPQLGVYSIMTGMGRHGVPGLFDLGGAILSLVLGAIMLGPMKAGLAGAAVAMTLPMALSGGILLPFYACRQLNMSVRRYVAEVVPGPFLSSIPLLICLIAARLALPEQQFIALLVGAGVGGSITLGIYWHFVLPAVWKAKRDKKRSGAVESAGAKPS